MGWKMIYLARRNPSLAPEQFPQAWREHSALGRGLHQRARQGAVGDAVLARAGRRAAARRGDRLRRRQPARAARPAGCHRHLERRRDPGHHAPRRTAGVLDLRARVHPGLRGAGGARRSRAAAAVRRGLPAPAPRPGSLPSGDCAWMQSRAGERAGWSRAAFARRSAWCTTTVCTCRRRRALRIRRHREWWFESADEARQAFGAQDLRSRLPADAGGYGRPAAFGVHVHARHAQRGQ
jgi:hypothetical protein